jgi:glutamine amidotransferase
MPMTVVVIDYGLGNIASILNMLKKVGVSASVASCPEKINNADKIILPGIGSFDTGMKNLAERGLIGVLYERVIKEKVAILGICLGMQLLTKRSQEGGLDGLGWVDADTVKFNFDNHNGGLRIPHMGWNTVEPVKENLLFKDMSGEVRFYFAHSYHVVCYNSSDIIAMTCYGYNFVSVFQNKNIFGVQFHPEKSHSFGMKVLENFVAL